MEKLTLEHLAGYLPYKLNMQHYESKRKGILQGISTNTLGQPYALCVNTNWYNDFVYKPILRPLSDLTKEITHNREAFVPYNLLEIDSSIVDFVVANNQPIIRLVDCEFIYAIDVYNNIIQKLQSWHFDIHGLIEKNLAIDINTI